MMGVVSSTHRCVVKNRHTDVVSSKQKRILDWRESSKVVLEELSERLNPTRTST